MIRFIYGMSGSGKSTYIASDITQSLRRGTKSLLIVPEQQTVETEQRYADLAKEKGIPVIDLEILNFTRLANSVFRRFGGLSYNYIGSGARQIIMWRALNELSPILTEYKHITVNDKKTLRFMTNAVSEFKRYNITPAMLGGAAETLKKDNFHHNLKNKLHDISLIYSLYQTLLHNEYDDPEEDLTRLSVILEKNNFFAGYNVYIDSFDRFTPQQIRIIRHIINQAENFTITLAILPGSSLIMLDSILNTENILKRIVASEHKTIDDMVVLGDSHRFTSQELKLTERYLWDFSHTEAVFKEKTQHIRLIECSDIFCEAEAAAKDILRRIRQGGRFYDNIVVIRDTSSYIGIIDAVFEKYNIPYFISTRTDLTTKPPVKLILSALKIIAGHWRFDDIIAYIKTGFSGLTNDECNILEIYASTWHINGRRWTDDVSWNMNPDGYTDILTERGKDIISAVNDIRIRLTAPIMTLQACFDGGCTVKSASEALYNFLNELNISQKAIQLGEDEPIQLWNIIIDALNQFVSVAADLVVNADEYMRLLSIIFDETDIGRIPTSLDEVIIGGAMSLRTGRAKNVYILGANEGKFPQNVSDDGMFNDTERVTLESLGIVLSPVSDRRASDELLYFYRAITCVEDNITVIYSSADLTGHALNPSLACDRLRILFPGLMTEYYSAMKPLELIEGYDASFEYTAMFSGTPAGDALKLIYLKDETYKSRLEALDKPFVQPYNTVLPETAQELYGSDLMLTQTRIESYTLCAFSYYCRYVLQLEEKKRAEIESVDIGNFMHRILERFMVYIKTDKGIRTDLTDDKIENITDKIIDEYIKSVIDNPKDRTNRITQLFRRLKRTTLLLIRNILDEFMQSEFTPAFFELPIKFGDKEGSEPFSIPLPDNSHVYVFGKVDRVDTYKKGNDVYIRVVDYKTGIKSFSLSDIGLGLNLQMLLYLFALWQNPSENFKARAGCGEGGQILPAGVLYFSAKAPEFSLDNYEDENAVTDKAHTALTRRGLLLDDKEILKAMEKNLEGRYIPVKLKSDGNFTAASSIQTLSDFGILMNDISDTLCNLGRQLKKGRADAIPLRKGGNNACEYCPHKPVCRIDNFK
ncbi:MAG: PD-(D/E)XK nuclease family protein [Eubacteriales bacterium]|jgi:ATP-dependent helicase/nuclease subunit B|nr:PD-(D/E)XK nuclease family protein [Eubacteriales bacterium]